MGRLRGRHGQLGRRQPRRVRHTAQPFDLVESPKIYGFQFNLLYSPGQNRDNDSSNLPSGESDCAGGNDPTSGGNPLISCSDGAWNNVVSANLSYTNGPLYMTAAGEWHQSVNRQSDLAGAYGVPITFATQNCSAFSHGPGSR